MTLAHVYRITFKQSLWDVTLSVASTEIMPRGYQFTRVYNSDCFMC